MKKINKKIISFICIVTMVVTTLFSASPLKVYAAGVSAFSQIEAQYFDSKFVFDVKADNWFNLKASDGVVSYICDKDYVVYDTVDFGSGGASGFQVNTSTYGGGGGKVQVILDNIEGNVLGECVISENYSWTTFSTSSCIINGESITGEHKVFLKFTGNAPMFNLKWFKFTGAATTSADATLSDLKVGGTTVSGFSAANTNYNVLLPEGTTIGDAQAQITAIKNDAKAEAPVITQVAELPGAATVAVTAEDGTTIKKYTINFTVYQASQFPNYVERGNKVTFDSSGKFTDSLASNTNIFADSNITLGAGNLTGPGEVIYKSDSNFKSASIDVLIGKWGLNFSELNDLKAYEVSYNNGVYTLGKKIDLVRKITPNLMTSKDTVMATYVSTQISAGVKYLRIILPTSDYFNNGSTGPFTDFKIEKISFESTNSASPQYSGSLIDNCTDFSKYVSGVDTSNLEVTNLTNIWDIRTFTTRQYVARKDSKIENKAMTYAVPSGKDIKSAYVEAYSFGVPSKYFQVWASRDGTNYLNITNELSYSKPGYTVAATDFASTTINLERVPDGTKYIQVRLPAYLNTDITPRITKVALMYGDEIAVNINDYNNQPSMHTANTSIAFATSKIKIDGTVEMDTSGKPIGDWQDAQSINIAGATDTNGDSHSSNIFFKYDYDNLYIGAQIKDPTPMINSNTGNGIWNGDNLEIFLGDEDINYSQYPDKTGTLLPSDRQIVLSGGIDYGYQYYINVNGVSIPATIIMDVKKSNDGKGYSIEASIPLATLNIKNSWNGSPIILNAVLNDGGSPGRGQWGWTTNGESTKKQRGLWGLATFNKVSASVDEVLFTSNVNNQTQLVTVSGKTLNVQGKDVTMIVKDPSGNISNIDQVKSDSNGNFTFTYNLNTNAAGNGIYTVSVSGEGISRPTMDTFNFVFDGTIIVAPVTPEAPNVTADDTLNKVIGMTTGMEYKLDSAGYVAYNATTFNAIDFSGNHVLLVRVAAEGINPVSNATTLTFTTNPVPVIPVTLTNTDITAVINAIKNTEVKGKITIDVTTNKIVAKEIFDAIKGTDKTIIFVAGNIQWIFNGKDIKGDTKTLNLTVKLATLSTTDSPNKDAIAQKVKNADVFVISFAKNGQLPGKATVRIKLAENWLNGKNKNDIYIYYYNITSKKFELVAKKLKVDEDGYVQFDITHNSDYFN